MKKIIFIGVVLAFLFCVVPVKAEEYELNTLIPVNTMATVKTEKFDYVDFSFLTQPNEAGNATINFSSIKNNMVTKAPISVNMLMFDQDKKNIGFITYCTDKDLDSSYSGFKLKGNEVSSFSINVSSKYYVSGKNYKDVSYIAVMDENKYCQIGGYTKYEGKTMNEILGIDVEEEGQESVTSYVQEVIDTAIKFFHSRYFKIVLMGIGAIIVLSILGRLLNALYQKMYTHKSGLVFVPIANIYITIKLVFGNIVAIVFGVLSVIAGVLYFLHIKFLAYIILVLWGISLLLVIVKLITKKYDLFYFEPSMDSSKYMDSSVGSDEEKRRKREEKERIKEEKRRQKEEQKRKKEEEKQHNKDDDLLSDDNFTLSQGGVKNNDAPKEVLGIDSILESLENPDGTDNHF